MLEFDLWLKKVKIIRMHVTNKMSNTNANIRFLQFQKSMNYSQKIILEQLFSNNNNKVQGRKTINLIRI